ncbi:uncharacterized protein BXZ73DRAFT_107221 [Epithele typhae]|uniref:uncharacterized protein n=1 Tax=Epithele typhae TaxID=378194 RepID=UPI002008211A|nr:uncharacterized protein BXZ73DRAFT_107221 [Epithele typhae]KAH9912774.1 hypothetical protein BXZ73DRAFT_107221 [Epithele typhae]
MDYFQRKDTHDPEKAPPLNPPAGDLPSEEARRLAKGRRILGWFIFLVCGILLFNSRVRVTERDLTPARQDSGQPWYCSQSAIWEKTPHCEGRDRDEASFRVTQPIELPLNAGDILTLSSWGLPEPFGGTLDISQTADAGSNQTLVDIEVLYPAGGADVIRDVSALRVCSTNPVKGEWRLNIFSSDWFEPNVRLKMHVRLPAAQCHSPLKLKALTANLANFDLRLHDLATCAHFEAIDIMTTNGSIHADALAADTISLATDNKPIHGTYNTTKSLLLKTTNAEIAVRANLFNDASPGGRPTTVHMHTTNAILDSQIGLYSSAHGRSGGNFLTIVRTSNAPLVLSFLDHPVDGRLQAAVRTTNKNAAVSLHPAFEGSFAVRTSNASPEVEYDDAVEDPAGEGRKRRFDLQHHTESYLRGRVHWGDNDEEKEKEGRVTVTTTNAVVKVEL